MLDFENLIRYPDKVFLMGYLSKFNLGLCIEIFYD
jgi:hypothetical protein